MPKPWLLETLLLTTVLLKTLFKKMAELGFGYAVYLLFESLFSRIVLLLLPEVK